MRIHNKKSYTLILIGLISFGGFAQDEPPTPTGPPPPFLPIDGPVLFVLCIALVYGVITILSLKKRYIS
ncbi:MAG: hypothetical protein HRT67_08425 [Flavobacteriaceae bacterium]|nr:hypothetical protein [Flavobacteriaceae bacterium]